MLPLTHPGYLSPPYLPVQRYLLWNKQRGARLLHWPHGLFVTFNESTFCVADIFCRPQTRKGQRVDRVLMLLLIEDKRKFQRRAEAAERLRRPTSYVEQKKIDPRVTVLTRILYFVSPEFAGRSSARFMRPRLLFLLSVSCLFHRPVRFQLCPIAARHRSAAARWRHCCGLGPGSSFVCLTRLPVVVGVEAQRKLARKISVSLFSQWILFKAFGQ